MESLKLDRELWCVVCERRRLDDEWRVERQDLKAMEDAARPVP
jgi:hypothetical protein